MQRPVQRLAGQAATGPEQDLPFVLDDDAVAQAYEERLLEQQAADPPDAAAQMQALRPRYGHRSPASALAGWCDRPCYPELCMLCSCCVCCAVSCCAILLCLVLYAGAVFMSL